MANDPKRPGHSGYTTMAAGVTDRFRAAGPWSVDELQAVDAQAIAGVLGQDPEHPLMPQFAAALRDVGSHIRLDFGGRFLGPPEAAASIPALAEIFASWDSFADVSSYDERRVPFYKRAQLAAVSPFTPAEVDSALWNRGRGRGYKSLPRPRSRTTSY